MLIAAYTETLVEAGIDEAGRGCLAGPVVAAAVILPKGYHHPLLKDSKKLSYRQREKLQLEIERDALAIGIGQATPDEIDRINVLRASILAMNRAVEALPLQPELLLIDGKFFTPQLPIPYQCIVKGDGLYYSIAAASVMAKTYRDHLMQEYAEQYPQYGWQQNVGYPTQAHYRAIAEHGVTPLHRRSFRLFNPTSG
ncbi:MAG: ribonuclease HII [Cytophagales bacterium]|nr:ribonuclease HII [Bernardetiaceae bacterium]MDW8205209.1 ribonuclease HII [Cytophagales bacterium]